MTVAMTKNATKLVGETTFQALSGRPVLWDMWSPLEKADVQHISATELADLVVVAPATANVIGKMASGIADDMVTTLLTGVDSPVVLAPAMNERMWANPIVQRNVATLKGLGYSMVGPESGWLACRDVGPGRMSEADAILDAIIPLLLKSPPKRVQC